MMNISEENQKLLKDLTVEALKSSPAFELFCKTIINEKGKKGEEYDIDIETRLSINPKEKTDG